MIQNQLLQMKKLYDIERSNKSLNDNEEDIFKNYLLEKQLQVANKYGINSNNDKSKKGLNENLNMDDYEKMNSLKEKNDKSISIYVDNEGNSSNILKRNSNDFIGNNNVSALMESSMRKNIGKFDNFDQEDEKINEKDLNYLNENAKNSYLKNKNNSTKNENDDVEENKLKKNHLNKSGLIKNKKNLGNKFNEEDDEEINNNDNGINNKNSFGIINNENKFKSNDKINEKNLKHNEKFKNDKLNNDKLNKNEKLNNEKLNNEKLNNEKFNNEKLNKLNKGKRNLIDNDNDKKKNINNKVINNKLKKNNFF